MNSYKALTIVPVHILLSKSVILNWGWFYHLGGIFNGLNDCGATNN